MIEKRFIDDGFEAIEEQSFTDTKTDKTYYVDYFDEIIDLLNELHEENQMLIIECKHQNKQKRNLKHELKRLGYSIEKIRDIINR